MAYVYRHIRLDKNEPFYIGIGSSQYYNRAYRHKNRSDLWKRISVRGGYEVEILLDNLTWDEACNKEKEFIALYGRIDLKTGCLANMTDGGDGTMNAIISEKQRKAVADANKRRIFTEEDRKKISERHTGRKQTEETKKKMSESIKNSEKHKIACKINSQKFIGYKHSEQAKLKIASSKARKVVQKSMINEIIKIWDSAKQIQRETNFSQANISRCCNGESKQSYGFRWEYYKK